MAPESAAASRISMVWPAAVAEQFGRYQVGPESELCMFHSGQMYRRPPSRFPDHLVDLKGVHERLPPAGIQRREPSASRFLPFLVAPCYNFTVSPHSILRLPSIAFV